MIPDRAQKLDPGGAEALPPPTTSAPPPPPPPASGVRPEMLSDRLGYPPSVGDQDWARMQRARNPEPKALPIEDLSESGLLWLINRVVFHPRGFRLAMAYTAGQFSGWILEGDGTEPHWFTEPADRDRFDRAEATLRAARHAAECNVCGSRAAEMGA